MEVPSAVGLKLICGRIVSQALDSLGQIEVDLLNFCRRVDDFHVVLTFGLIQFHEATFDVCHRALRSLDHESNRIVTHNVTDARNVL